MAFGDDDWLAFVIGVLQVLKLLVRLNQEVGWVDIAIVIHCLMQYTAWLLIKDNLKNIF